MGQKPPSKNKAKKKTSGPVIETVLDHIAWSYANLARADAALAEGCVKYGVHHHMIRSKLFKGLRTGTMSMQSLYDDERLKLKFPQACCYCGSTERLSLDHLIPRFRGGEDDADNLVWACRSCNSSKGNTDLLRWMRRKDKFPSIFLLRRYLKLVARYCERNELMRYSLNHPALVNLPFDIALIPQSFPELVELQHWVDPAEADQERSVAQEDSPGV